MTDELAYALITPYSLYKSRTGGIIGRLLAHARLEFVAARMYVFSDAFVDEYKKCICPRDCDPEIAKTWHDYLDKHLRETNPWGYLPRAMVLLFRGPNAVRHLKDDVIGKLTELPMGDTIRGTYGDLIRDAQGHIQYFEPAVITGGEPEINRRHLELFSRYALSDGGVLAGRCKYDQANVQTSLVMLKPDNFYRRSRRPGNIIDTFSLTGLRIVAAKLFNMTVAQGEEFYGPLRSIFIRKLKGNVTNEIFARLSDAFDFDFTQEDAASLADRLAERNANTEFNKIVEYMTGVDPSSIEAAQKATASRARCLALVYEGPNAIDKVREVLGSTDPTKAEPGTVRSDFGRDLMRNGAHASDSADNAERERRIVGVWQTETQECDFQQIIRQYLGK